MRTSFAAFICGWAVIVGSLARAASGGNVAILDFKPNNVSAGDAAVVSDFVRSAFVKSGVYTVVDKAGMDRILAEQAFQQTGCTDSDCAVKLGKLLNVGKMVVGNYSMAGSVRFLTASLVAVETGEIERTGKVKGFEPGNIDEAAEDLARQLSGLSAVPGTAQAGGGPAVEDTQAKARADEVQRKADAEAARDAARKEKERIKAERAAARALEPVDPRVARGRIGIGLNAPGFGLRALIGGRWMVEAKGQYEKEAQSAGGRLYRYVFPAGRLYPYLGVEGSYVLFKDEGVDADGMVGEAYAGIEYFIWRKLSLQCDIGPAYVGLDGGGVSVSGIRFVVNFGLTLYL